MKRLPLSFPPMAVAALLCAAAASFAEVDNLKVVTEASPDYTDLESLVQSVTSRWETPEEKCWAMFYWNHLARRQTNPMIVHGFEVTDPIRQFNDYGFTQCSTISGINCSIWNAMGLKTKFWDLSNHTVPEVEYGGRWHAYDNSLSTLYTLCDGKTLAGIEDIGKVGACAASDGNAEPGHIAKYHCLHCTSPTGFLTGSDTARSLEEETKVFNPSGLKYRNYYYNWDRGHRYILNLRESEVYTRHYTSQGETPEFYVPSGGKDLEAKAKFKQRGNGLRTFQPALTAESLPKLAHSVSGLRVLTPAGLAPANPTAPGEVVFKLEGANVITGVHIQALCARAAQSDVARIAVSATNGLTWKDVWQSDATGKTPATLSLGDEVNGAYEVLVKVTLQGRAELDQIAFETITQLNAKTQPRLNIGANTVYVGAGDQTESIVLWPELQGGKVAPHLVDQHNVAFKSKNPGYMGTLYPEKKNEDAWITFRIDAPRDLTRLTYGGRIYNRAPKSHIDLLHSFDGGKTWSKSYSLTDTNPPWDVIHYETITQVPAGTRSVLCKYLLSSSSAENSGCSIFAVRMEADHRTADPAFKPVEVTFAWAEEQADHSFVDRSHTQLITSLPARYTINVGGVDHPVMKSLRTNLQGAFPGVKYGYSDGQDHPAPKFVPRWITTGRNLAVGKPYTVSVPSETTYGAGDDGHKLTDGIAGPTFAGGSSYKYGALWSAKKNPVITLDLGAPTACASLGMNFHGYPWHDALQGQINDKIEVLISDDGATYRSIGFLETNQHRKDVPVNFMVPDNEKLTGGTFRLIPDKAVQARYVQFKIQNVRVIDVTELEVLDAISFKPFDLRLALPDGARTVSAR